CIIVKIAVMPAIFYISLFTLHLIYSLYISSKARAPVQQDIFQNCVSVFRWLPGINQYPVYRRYVQDKSGYRPIQLPLQIFYLPASRGFVPASATENARPVQQLPQLTPWPGFWVNGTGPSRVLLQTGATVL